VQDLVDNMFRGGTSTAFCFGQTASGKTFTLFGAGGGQETLEGASEAEAAERGGVYLLAAHDIYRRVEAMAAEAGAVVALSMFEIKGQKLFDLLHDRAELTALEDQHGVLQLVGLTQHACANLDVFLEASTAGRGARSTASTGANATSSRSHCAMLVYVYQDGRVLGKLSLIDLAGSERGADNEDTDAGTRKEGRDINTSLLALKEVIRALQSGHHAPFRQSRLTQVLQESLTGQQCKTVVIACVSGAEHDTHHTVNTLRYAAELRPKGSGKLKAKVKAVVLAKRVATKQS
jgi:kinesin family protein 2/24